MMWDTVRLRFRRNPKEGAPSDSVTKLSILSKLVMLAKLPGWTEMFSSCLLARLMHCSLLLLLPRHTSLLLCDLFNKLELEVGAFSFTAVLPPCSLATSMLGMEMVRVSALVLLRNRCLAVFLPWPGCCSILMMESARQ